MTYTLTMGSSVIRDADGTWIPDDPANTSWQAYQAWLAAGNTPNPYVPPPPPIPSTAPMWAVRSVLKTNGLFDQARTFIDGSDNENLKLVWEYGNFADRNSPSIALLASELGLTDAQVDQMFIDANNIVV
jgi:hypothetical protein